MFAEFDVARILMCFAPSHSCGHNSSPHPPPPHHQTHKHRVKCNTTVTRVEASNELCSVSSPKLA